MPDSTTEKHVLGSYDSTDWTGPSSGGAGCLFFGFGFAVFLLCLILMVFVLPLRNPFACIAVCTTIATVATVRVRKEATNREQAFLADLANRINPTVLQLTGNPRDGLSTDQLRVLIAGGQSLPLLVNGVPGVELRVDKSTMSPAKKDATQKTIPAVTRTRVLAGVAAPEYGLTSFDRLLAADHGPDTTTGSGPPRQDNRDEGEPLSVIGDALKIEREAPIMAGCGQAAVSPNSEIERARDSREEVILPKLSQWLTRPLGGRRCSTRAG